MTTSAVNLAWIDLETTSLAADDPCAAILEVAVVITTPNLEEMIAASWVIKQEHDLNLSKLSPDVVEMHSKNGLWADVVRSDQERFKVSSALSQLLTSASYFPEREKPLLCGSTINFERDWLRAHMLVVFNQLHYRSIDVSSFKEVVRRRKGEGAVFPSNDNKAHRAMDDIRASIAELQHYYEVLGL